MTPLKMQFSKPWITEAEVEAAAQAIRDGHLATEKISHDFEQVMATKFNFKNVVSVNSGTSALYLSLLAYGVGVGDEVLVPAYGIMCTVNAIIATGAKPVFCDVDRWTYNVGINDVLPKINRRTKAIIPVSLFGVPVDVDVIRAELKEEIAIVEDSIEALGSSRNGVYVGSRTNDVATFGFYPNKQITTCQGGIVVTGNDVIADKVRRLTKHGYGMGDGLWSPGFGFNMRLPDPLAAIGIVQLSRFAELQDRLVSVRKMYDYYFSEYRVQRPPPHFKATEFVYVIELPTKVAKRKFCEEMQELGIPVRPYFNALHTSASFDIWGAYPVSEELGRRTVALPFHFDIDKEDVDLVWDAFQKVAI